jgi:hypothetical protein
MNNFYIHPSSLIPLPSNHGGKGGIRTHGTLLRFTAFPMLPIQPLLHLSLECSKKIKFSNRKRILRNLKSALRKIQNRKSKIGMAERVGFEPTVPVKAQQFSRLPDSTTLAPLRTSEFSILRSDAENFKSGLHLSFVIFENRVFYEKTSASNFGIHQPKYRKQFRFGD